MVVSTHTFSNAFTRMVAQRRTDHVEETPEIKELMGNMDHEKVHRITANISFRRKRQTVGNFFEGIIIEVTRATIYGVLSEADVNDEELQTLFKGVGSFLLEA